MVEKTIVGVRKALRQLLQQRKINVDKIVIFGSYAAGKEKKDSDIDIIIVSKNFRNKGIFEKVKITQGIHRALVRQAKKPVDIMYYSDVEWKKGNSLIVNAAKIDGKLI